MLLKVLIVDDEAPARSEMRFLLDKIKDIEVLGEAITASEALKLLKEVKYDIVFLDINMPGMSGIEMAQEIKKMAHQPAIIFTTAYSRFAVDAFEVDAVDYLVKPIAKKRLMEAIARINESKKIKQIESADEGIEPEHMNRIPVTRQSKTILLMPEEIYYIESQGEYTIIHSQRGRFISSIRLKDFEKKLSSKSFFRVHRSFVVNIDYVKELISLYGGLCMLRLTDEKETEVPVSRRQARELKVFLGMK